MRFRPCIDIHNGQVKQIVGGSLTDHTDFAEENFVSEQGAEAYATLYKSRGLSGGHIILLNPEGTEYYKQDVQQAKSALQAYEGGLQIGGGMTPQNAKQFLTYGASHIIVTSYVFQNGVIRYDRLKEMRMAVGRERLVLDLSCRRKGEKFHIVTNRWQTFTEVELNKETLERLSSYCNEFLIHAVDVEGKAQGIECEVATLLGEYDGVATTYAGGVASMKDLELLKKLGNNKVDVTIGSALDLFGGKIKFEEIISYCNV